MKEGTGPEVPRSPKENLEIIRTSTNPNIIAVLADIEMYGDPAEIISPELLEETADLIMNPPTQ